MKCHQCESENRESARTCDACGANLFGARLRVLKQGENAHIFRLEPREYKLGRGEANDIVLADDSVSRHHAEISFRDGLFYITDLKSKNGSLLNNHHFRTRQLSDLDCIQLGNVVLYFYDENSTKLWSGDNVATVDFVQDEFFKLASAGRTRISSTDVVLTMLDLLISLLHCARALLYEVNTAGKIVLMTGRDKAGTLITKKRLTLSERSLIENMNGTSRGVVQMDDGSTATLTEIPKSGWSQICIQLLSTDENMLKRSNAGLGYLLITSGRKKSPITGRRHELFRTLVQQITIAVENKILQAGNETFDTQKLAQGIRRRFDSGTGKVPASLKIKVIDRPCDQISGDYFDIIQLSDSQIGLAVGDVSGKGVPAALLASTVRAAIHSQMELNDTPEAIIRNLNQLLIRSTAESIFLTLFFGVADLTSNVLTYINAGHPPPMILTRNRGLVELVGTSPPLGILEGEFNAVRNCRWHKGDMMVLYTDGVIECQNGRKQIFGRRRFREMAQCYADSADKIAVDRFVTSVCDEMKSFRGDAPLTDDLTLLAIKRVR